jgi:polar amino acid transport system substrate-binding protein
MVIPGFNRRFSSLTRAVQEYFSGRASPIEVVCRVNAGSLKADSWYQDEEEGGWRIVSEGCHFVDLISALCGCKPVEVYASMIHGDVPGRQNDNCAVTLKMEDGSVGVLAYLANGDPFFEKERIEVHGQGRSAVIENWRRARLCAGGRKRTVKPSPAGKGHKEEMAAFIEAVRTGGRWPLMLAEAVATTSATLAILESLRLGKPVAVQS